MGYKGRSWALKSLVPLVPLGPVDSLPQQATRYLPTGEWHCAERPCVVRVCGGGQTRLGALILLAVCLCVPQVQSSLVSAVLPPPPPLLLLLLPVAAARAVATAS